LSRGLVRARDINNPQFTALAAPDGGVN